MNAEQLKELKAIRGNIDSLIADLEGEDKGQVIDLATERKAMDKKSKKTSASKKADDAPEETDGVELTQEKLDGMTYNNLKKLAKEMGLSATGARDEITARILNSDSESEGEDEEQEQEEVEEAPKKEAKKSTRKLGKKAEPEEEDEEPEEEEDPVVVKVNEAVEGMTNEQIADFLSEVGISAKGKRQALIAKVVKAVKEGAIDLEDDEDEEGEQEAPATDSVEDGDGEFDVNDTENPDMTEERKTAIEAFVASTEKSFEKGKLSRKDIIKWLNDFQGTKEKMTKKSDEDLVEEYVYFNCLFIDDDGDMIEEGAYNVNDVPFCCGSPLKYDEESKTYICEDCGEEYGEE